MERFLQKRLIISLAETIKTPLRVELLHKINNADILAVIEIPKIFYKFISSYYWFSEQNRRIDNIRPTFSYLIMNNEIHRPRFLLDKQKMSSKWFHNPWVLQPFKLFFEIQSIKANNTSHWLVLHEYCDFFCEVFQLTSHKSLRQPLCVIKTILVALASLAYSALFLS